MFVNACTFESECFIIGCDKSSLQKLPFRCGLSQRSSIVPLHRSSRWIWGSMRRCTFRLRGYAINSIVISHQKLEKSSSASCESNCAGQVELLLSTRNEFMYWVLLHLVRDERRSEYAAENNLHLQRGSSWTRYGLIRRPRVVHQLQLKLWQVVSVFLLMGKQISASMRQLDQQNK